jgi:hypothetical protein
MARRSRNRAGRQLGVAPNVEPPTSTIAHLSKRTTKSFDKTRRSGEAGVMATNL